MQQWYQCPNCGGQVAFGMRFCGSCGTRLNWPTQSPPTQPPPNQSPPQLQCQEVDEEVEGRGSTLAKILDLCENDPDAGLGIVEGVMAESPEILRDPFAYWAKAMAYCGKGLLQLIRSKAKIDFTGFNGEEWRDFGITDTHLDCLEKSLHEIRRVEQISPGFIEDLGDFGMSRMDLIGMVLERCRPGRVQEILGKTKLRYFGRGRIGHGESLEITKEEYHIFRDIFFTSRRIAKSATLALDGEDEAGRRYVAVSLGTSLDFRAKASVQFPSAGAIMLYSDGTYEEV